MLTGTYHIPSYQWRVKCYLTNKVGMGTFSAPGRYESCFFRERMLDIVAEDLGIDPVELRRRNLIQPSEMPYRVGYTRPDPTPIVYDSGNYPALLTKVLEVLDYDNRKHLQGQQVDGEYHGIGVACFVKSTGGGQSFEGARVVVTGGEAVAVYLGIATMGQGHETVMAQICASGLGVPIEYVAVYHGSTDLMPFGGGTHASRGTIMAGNALYIASQNLKEKILRISAAYLEIDREELEFSQGKVHRKTEGPHSPLLHLGEVLQLANPASIHSQGEIGLEATDYFRSSEDCYPCGAHAVHLKVDPETGEITILKYAVAEDVGHVINPLLLKGQIVGAAAQGIGATILEELVYDENGQPLAGTLVDYLLPSSLDIPAIDTAVEDLAPSPRNPLGVKGAGEIGIVATGAAIANAVSHALGSRGVQVKDLPLSPDRLRRMINRSGAKA